MTTIFSINGSSVVTSRVPRRPRAHLVAPALAFQIRVLSGTPLAVVAARVGVSPGTVLGWERRHRPPSSTALAERYREITADLALQLLSARLSH